MVLFYQIYMTSQSYLQCILIYFFHYFPDFINKIRLLQNMTKFKFCSDFFHKSEEISAFILFASKLFYLFPIASRSCVSRNVCVWQKGNEKFFVISLDNTLHFLLSKIFQPSFLKCSSMRISFLYPPLFSISCLCSFCG